MSKYLVLAPLLGIAYSLTGCTLRCSEIGCQDGVEIAYSRELEIGEYEIEIETPDGTASCSLTVDEGTFLPECTGSLQHVRVEPRLTFVDGTPESVSIRISSEAGTIADDSFDPEYESHQPN